MTLIAAMAAVTVALCVPSYAAKPSLAPSGGYWLLDLAWNQAATLAQVPSRADATELVCLLQAATRLDPRLAEAWRQQYDLLAGLGRQPEAWQALAKYVELSPDDEPAWLAFVAQQVTAAQTAEQRLTVCQRFLARKDVPGPAVSFLHRTIAELLANRLQTEQALQHAQQAVRAFPYDLAAQRFLMDLRGQRGPVADLHLALWATRRNPSDIGTITQVAWLVDSLGLHEDAEAWYTAAQEIAGKLGMDTTALSLRMADHWLDAGRTEQAISRLRVLTGRPNAPAEAWLLLADAYQLMDKPEDAKEAATRAFEGLAPASAPTSAAATGPATQPVPASDRTPANWVSLLYLGRTDDVLDETRAAFEANPDPIGVRRTFGWALLKAGAPEQAIPIFAPAAEIDPWCSLGLAEAQFAHNDKAAAMKTLQRLSPNGAAWRQAKRWAKQIGIELPTPEPNQVRNAKMLLAGFSRNILRLPLQPNEFLQLKVTLDPPPSPGEPWFARIELTNISPQPIYCGPDGALMPNVLISAMVYDPAARDLGQRLLISLYRQMVLEPKKTVSLYRPIDDGRVRQALRNPYRDVTVTFTTILDPVRTATGAWQPGPAGLVAEPATGNRRASVPAKAGDLLALARNGSQVEKVNLARQVACMLAGQQEQTAAQSQPAGPSAEALNQAMALLLQDSDAPVAACALAQADYVPFTSELAGATAPQVGDNAWLTRLLAIRLFAHKQGEKFTRVLGGMSTSDPDPLVREMAGAYHAAFQAGQKSQ